MSSTISTAIRSSIRYVDIGINLSDLQYSGVYHGKKVHDDDRIHVLDRALQTNVSKMLVTASSLHEATTVLDLCTSLAKLSSSYENLLYSTVGVHPCSALDLTDSQARHGISPSEYLQQMDQLIQRGTKLGVVKAFGEIGLDYDRLHFAGKEDQITAFKLQLDLATKFNLPLFLHSRAAAKDFKSILEPYLSAMDASVGTIHRGGVVHSFTGTVEEMQELVDLGLYIGINGCSLKTEENLDVVRAVPLSHLLLETDGPWCEIRPSHASFKLHLAAHESQPKKPSNLIPYPLVKKEKFKPGSMVSGRCEPCAIGLVAHVVASVKNIPLEEVALAAYQNSINLFNLDDPQNLSAE